MNLQKIRLATPRPGAGNYISGIIYRPGPAVHRRGFGSQGLWVVIAGVVGPKQSHDGKEGLLRFARNDTREDRTGGDSAARAANVILQKGGPRPPRIMLTKRIIPCLDVDAGRVVKGTSFVNLRDAGDPAELASVYDREGGDELVFLDITASADARDTMIDVVQRVSERVFIPLTVGGGIRSVEDMRRMLNAGADKVSVNTAAVNDHSLIQKGAAQFGNQCIVVAIDAKRVTPELDPNRIDSLAESLPRLGSLALTPESRWEVYTHGGRTPTGIDAVRWGVRAVELGAGEILLTSMDADGHLEGYDLALTRAISQSVSVPVIASGGAGNLDHLFQAFDEGQADAVLAASIFHFGTYSIQEAKEYLKERGLPIRTQPPP